MGYVGWIDSGGLSSLILVNLPNSIWYRDGDGEWLLLWWTGEAFWDFCTSET